MTPIEKKPVKLSYAMVEVINKMRDGWILRLSVIQGRVKLHKAGDYIHVHKGTFNSLGLKGIIAKGPAIDNCYTLTELGKTIKS